MTLQQGRDGGRKDGHHIVLTPTTRASGWWKGLEESNNFMVEEMRMSYFTGKSDKRHWKVEAPCYPGTWHSSWWSFPEWSYPVNAGLCVSCSALILQSLSWLPLWVPRERLFTASASSQICDMHWFHKMLWQVQILILLSQDKFVLILKCCALALFVNAISGAEVSKALLPSVSRQSKSVMGAWLEILQSTRFWIIQIHWERSRLYLTIRSSQKTQSNI